ncbi:MAG: hypothetical protein AAGA34_01600 [Pseudomonadota bacterium]
MEHACHSEPQHQDKNSRTLPDKELKQRQSGEEYRRVLGQVGVPTHFTFKVGVTGVTDRLATASTVPARAAQAKSEQ